jgi:hypothetical protein
LAIDRLDLVEAIREAILLADQPETVRKTDGLMQAFLGVVIPGGGLGARFCLIHAAIGLLGLRLEETQPVQELPRLNRFLNELLDQFGAS